MNDREKVMAKEALDTIESIMNVESHLRRAHAVGVAFDGLFQPTGAAMPWTSAAHLQRQDVPVIVRFSHSSPSGDPAKKLNPLKGMAVRFELPDGQRAHLVMVNVPIFISQTPEAFIRFIQTFEKEKMSGAERLDSWMHDANYKSFATILKKLQPFRNFESLHYYSIHAFFLVDEAQKKQAVRFEWQPVSSNDVHVQGRTMEDELIQKVEKQAVQFRLLIQFAEAGDPTNDPTKAWPGDRKKIEAGILTLTAVRADNAESIVFDPTVTASGVECSDDPVLYFRSAVYAESARRRGVLDSTL